MDGYIDPTRERFSLFKELLPNEPIPCSIASG